MSVKVLTDCAAYVQGYDFTTDVNEARLTSEAEVKDKTTFGSAGWREFMNGLRTAKVDLKGFWQSAATQSVDSEAFPNLGVADQVYTFVEDDATPPNPVAITDENVAFMLRGGEFSYSLGGPVGDINPFTLASQNTAAGGVRKGLLVKPKGTVSATGALGSTLDTLGFGVPSGQSLYVAFHHFIVGTTITVQVQSDDNVGFATPTTVATFGPITTVGATWMTPVAGPLTDRYYRLNVSAITGTFTVAAAIAIT